MGIPKKGSRTTEVDGKPFRYLVREDHIDDHPDQKELNVTVQEDVDRPGNVLQFRWGYGCEISPALIRDAVRVAQKNGWSPSKRGSAFTLRDAERLLIP